MPISKYKKSLEGYCVPQVTIKKCCARYLYNTITESNWGFLRRCKNRYELRNRDSLVWIFFSFSYCCCLYTIIRYWGQTSTFSPSFLCALHRSRAGSRQTENHVGENMLYFVSAWHNVFDTQVIYFIRSDILSILCVPRRSLQLHKHHLRTLLIR